MLFIAKNGEYANTWMTFSAEKIKTGGLSVEIKTFITYYKY